MSERASMEFELKFGRTGKKSQSGRIPNIVILGNFGQGNPDRSPVFSSRLPISVDNIDALIGRLRPQVDVTLTYPLPVQTTLVFRSVEDFHPDALCKSVPIFQKLSGIQKALARSSTERIGLDELARLVGKETALEDTNSAESGAGSTIETTSDVVQRLLGGASRPAPATPATRTVDQLIRSALGDANIENKTVTAEVASREVASLQTATMRGILTHAVFCQLESCWRGLDWLARRVEEEEANIEIIDAPWDQLQEDLKDSAKLENSILTRLLCEVEDENRPDIVVGLYTIERDIEDLSLLTSLGAIAARAGAVFATHGSLQLIGCDGANELDTPNNWSLPDDDTTQFWLEVLNHPVAESLNLLAPRFILRYPFGGSTDSIDTFAFEELPVKPDHEAFCWGNPALLFAYSRVSGQPIIDDLPIPIYDNGCGQAQQPPIEANVSDRIAALAADKGLRLLLNNIKSGNVSIGLGRHSIV